MRLRAADSAMSPVKTKKSTSYDPRCRLCGNLVVRHPVNETGREASTIASTLRQCVIPANSLRDILADEKRRGVVGPYPALGFEFVARGCGPTGVARLAPVLPISIYARSQSSAGRLIMAGRGDWGAARSWADERVESQRFGQALRRLKPAYLQRQTAGYCIVEQAAIGSIKTRRTDRVSSGPSMPYHRPVCCRGRTRRSSAAG